jgi:hypothetical protein
MNTKNYECLGTDPASSITHAHLIDKRNVMISRGWLIWTVARDSAVSPTLHAAGSLAHSEFSYWPISSICPS